MPQGRHGSRRRIFHDRRLARRLVERNDDFVEHYPGLLENEPRPQRPGRVVLVSQIDREISHQARPAQLMGAHSDENRRRTQRTAEEAGVRTYRGRLAPSNGFEARASHRTRCSSEIDIAGSLHRIKGQSGRVSRSGEHLAAAQHDARVTGPPGCPHLIQILEDLDCQIAADAATVPEGRGAECALG